MVLLPYKNGLLRLSLPSKQTVWLFHNLAFASALIQPNVEAVILSPELTSHNLTCNLETYCNGLPLSALFRLSLNFPFNASVNSHASKKKKANLTSMKLAEGEPRSSIVQLSTSRIKQQRQPVSAPQLSEQVALAPCHDRNFVSFQETFNHFQLLWAISKLSSTFALRQLCQVGKHAFLENALSWLHSMQFQVEDTLLPSKSGHPPSFTPSEE
jgi:hypothetical protein